ncbi:MAG: TIM barrel protein [Kiritimatiellae bacterium]|nr:TIM barrel protein [Kiritimatiellia bacterium]
MTCGVTGRIAVLADLHYVVEAAAMKSAILRWALGKAEALGCKAVVCAGDMLGTGTVREARELHAMLASQPLPVFITHGNSELRTPSETADALSILASDAAPPPGVVLVDSSRLYADPAELDAIDGGCGLLVTHVPPQEWGAAPLEAFRRAVDRGAVSLAVAGHEHADAILENGRCVLLRGLDPDKATGGPPSFATFVTDGRGWRLEATHEFPGIRPEEWSDDFRRSFLDDLGLSTMYDPFGGLAFATDNGVKCVELRHGSWKPEEGDALAAAIGSWRAAGGRVLSSHLPSLSFPDGEVSGEEGVRQACETALSLGCDRVTIHVPGVKAREWESRKDEVVAAYMRALAPLAGSRVAIGVENMHTTGEAPEERGFGFIPQECAELIGLLREAVGPSVGFHFDIGHARNNRPFDSRYPIGVWYSSLGGLCNGMHIHQVVTRPGGGMENHLPLTGFFDKLIPLSSLILARREGLLNRAPMFIEVRGGAGPASWSALRV